MELEYITITLKVLIPNYKCQPAGGISRGITSHYSASSDTKLETWRYFKDVKYYWYAFSSQLDLLTNTAIWQIFFWLQALSQWSCVMTKKISCITWITPNNTISMAKTKKQHTHTATSVERLLLFTSWLSYFTHVTSFSSSHLSITPISRTL